LFVIALHPHRSPLIVSNSLVAIIKKLSIKNHHLFGGMEGLSMKGFSRLSPEPFKIGREGVYFRDWPELFYTIALIDSWLHEGFVNEMFFSIIS
jgi:hypothetical protein